MSIRSGINPYGFFIPPEIWNIEIGLQHKLFLSEIYGLDNGGGMNKTNKYFAEVFNISGSRSAQIIGDLKREGLIEITYGYNANGQTYRVIYKGRRVFFSGQG